MLLLLLWLTLLLTLDDADGGRHRKPLPPLKQQQQQQFRGGQNNNNTTSRRARCGYVVKKRHFGGRSIFLFVAGVSRRHVHAVVARLVREGAAAFEDVSDVFIKGEQAKRGVRNARLAAVERLGRETRPLVVLNNENLTFGTYLRHPSLHAIAAVAEAAGVDLRVIVAEAPARYVLTNITHKHAAILADGAAVLAAEIALIDPAFVHSADPLKATPPPPPPPPKTTTNSPLEDVLVAHVAAINDGLLRNATDEYYVPKTVFSNTKRVVFVAGLEGTGHHAMRRFFLDCRNYSGLCRASKVVSRLLYDRAGQPRGAFVFWKPDEGILLRRRELVARLEEIAASNATVLLALNTATDEDDSAWLGLSSDKNVPIDAGMMSYPNFKSALRGSQHVNLRELAAFCEESGVDLRVLVLSRPTRDVLVSTTVHRRYETAAREAAILADSAAVLTAHLRLIDPAFRMCVPYATIGRRDWWEAGVSSRASWLHPSLRGPTLDSALSTIYNRDPPQAPGVPASELNISQFLSGTRDAYETHAAASADLLYRLAGCGCGA